MTYSHFKHHYSTLSTAALLYEWTYSDWVGHGVLYAAYHRCLQTRGEPQRWVKTPDNLNWKHSQQQMSEKMTCCNYGWVLHIRSCYLIIISNGHALTFLVLFFSSSTSFVFVGGQSLKIWTSSSHQWVWANVCNFVIIIFYFSPPSLLLHNLPPTNNPVYQLFPVFSLPNSGTNNPP